MFIYWYYIDLECLFICPRDAESATAVYLEPYLFLFAFSNCKQGPKHAKSTAFLQVFCYAKLQRSETTGLV